MLKSISRVCLSCKSESPTVYSVGWMCLLPSCVGFWRRDSLTFSPEVLEYDSQFIQLRREPIFPKLSLTPESPVTEPSDDTTSERYTSGWWCEPCGLLNCRCVVFKSELSVLTASSSESVGSVGTAQLALCVRYCRTDITTVFYLLLPKRRKSST